MKKILRVCIVVLCLLALAAVAARSCVRDVLDQFPSEQVYLRFTSPDESTAAMFSLKHESLRWASDVEPACYITLVDLEKTGKGIRFSLGVKDTKGAGVLLDSKRRRTAAACWHTLGHFIDELFVVAEEAEVYSDWTGSWITKAGGNRQDKNIGTKGRILMLSRACDCNSRAQKAIERLILGPVKFRTREK